MSERLSQNFKMLLSEKLSKCFISSESSDINLPTEVWIHTWSFLDFETVQKTCTLVSKGWLSKIRNSTRLSGEVILKLENCNVKDINNALSRWPKLKVLQLSDCCCNYLCTCNSSRLNKLMAHWEKSKKFDLITKMLGVNLTDNPLLRKIIIPKSMWFVELGNWGKVFKVWFDPKNWTPVNLESVNNLIIYVDYIPNLIFFLFIGQVLVSVEEIYITGKKRMLDVKFDSEFILTLQDFLLGFKKLTKVRIVVPVDITDFLDFLHAVANVKDVKFWLNVCIVHNHLERKYVKKVFKEGFKIIVNTFPSESTDIHIGDVEYQFRIEKECYKVPKLQVY